jgi:hypothetical protein
MAPKIIIVAPRILCILYTGICISMLASSFWRWLLNRKEICAGLFICAYFIYGLFSDTVTSDYVTSIE